MAEAAGGKGGTKGPPNGFSLSLPSWLAGRARFFMSLWIAGGLGILFSSPDFSVEVVRAKACVVLPAGEF